MSFEDQLGALASRLQQLRNDATGALELAATNIHTRIDDEIIKVRKEVSDVQGRIADLESRVVSLIERWYDHEHSNPHSGAPSNDPTVSGLASDDAGSGRSPSSGSSPSSDSSDPNQPRSDSSSN